MYRIVTTKKQVGPYTNGQAPVMGWCEDCGTSGKAAKVFKSFLVNGRKHNGQVGCFSVPGGWIMVQSSDGSEELFTYYRGFEGIWTPSPLPAIVANACKEYGLADWDAEVA